ncbi:UNVERIFIED_CONTAM: hypothetical protein FKN15_059404 [Acipenser sinensis]
MLKPGDPSGSAFLKVDPAYIQHWQQLFPQSQLKTGALSQLQPHERADLPVESLRQRPTSISSASFSVSTPSSSSCSSSSLAGLTQLSVPQIALFGHSQCPEIPTSVLSGQSKELYLSSQCKNDRGPRIKFTPEELDYYLYGQQRMEIIPLNNHTSDPNNRCDMCVDNRNGECPMHGPLHSLRRLVGTSSSASTVPPPEIPEWLRDLPREVCLCTSTVPGLGYGICAAQRILQGTWIGPFQGVPLLLDKPQPGVGRNSRHMWECEKKLLADGTCFGGQRVFVFALPSQRRGGSVNVPASVMEAMSRQETLQPFTKTSKGPSSVLLRSMVFPHTSCTRSFSLLDKPGQVESGFNQMNGKNQRVLASPTSTSQLSSEFSDWHLWKCGQCFKTFTQRILLQMHVCTQNPDR